MAPSCTLSQQVDRPKNGKQELPVNISLPDLCQVDAAPLINLSSISLLINHREAAA